MGPSFGQYIRGKREKGKKKKKRGVRARSIWTSHFLKKKRKREGKKKEGTGRFWKQRACVGGGTTCQWVPIWRQKKKKRERRRFGPSNAPRALNFFRHAKGKRGKEEKGKERCWVHVAHGCVSPPGKKGGKKKREGGRREKNR